MRCSVFTLYTSLDPAINRLNCRNSQENLEKWLMLDVRDLTAQLKQAYAAAPVVKAEKQAGYFVTVPAGTQRNREELASKLDAHLILTTRKACPHKRQVNGPQMSVSRLASHMYPNSVFGCRTVTAFSMMGLFSRKIM